MAKTYTLSIWLSVLLPKPCKHKNIVLITLLLRTISAVINKEYTNFDAQTTSNCCHGTALLAKQFLSEVRLLDLTKLQQQIEIQLQPIHLNNSNINIETFISSLPKQLVDLTSMFLLNFVVDIDKSRGRLTKYLKLQSIAPVSGMFGRKLIQRLQRFYSNLVIDTYHDYIDKMKTTMLINGIPVALWSKYVTSKYLRIDKRKVKYASALFSIQTALAHIINNNIKMAIVNDLICPITTQTKARYFHLLQGNGKNLEPISSDDILYNNTTSMEPVVVFGGVCLSETYDLQSLSLRMQPWLYQCPSLILANDTHYPQFPKVLDDPNFNNDPILPEEDSLKKIIETHAKITGTSTEDPSLFCLTHIFPASLQQFVTKTLPSCFIPCKAWSLHTH